MKYVRSWPHTGHVHYFRCYKSHKRSSLLTESLRLLVFLGAVVVVMSVVLVARPFGTG